jgi:hypothetical protein
LNQVTKLLALAAVGASLVVAGCRDDDDGATSSPATTDAGASGITGVADSKEQWIATADEVCANANKELTSALQEAGLDENTGDEELASLVETAVIPIQQSLLDTLRGLAPPEGEEDSVNELLDSLEFGLDEMEADPASALQEGQGNPLAEAAQLDDAYGLQECGA